MRCFLLNGMDFYIYSVTITAASADVAQLVEQLIRNQ